MPERRIKLPDGKTLTIGEGADASLLNEFLTSKGYNPEDVATLNRSPLNPYVAAAATGLGKSLTGMVGAAQTPGLFGSHTFPQPGAPSNPEEFTEKVGQKLGGWHENQSTMEDLAAAGGSMLPAALLGPEAGAGLGAGGKIASWIPKLFAYGFAPGVASEIAGKATQGINVPEQVPFIGGEPIEPAARMAGAMVGGPVARRAVTPLPVSDPDRLAANKVLSQNNMGQTAGQFTNRNWLMALEGKDTGTNPAQRSNYTSKMMEMGGKKAPNATIGQQGTVPAMVKQAEQNLAGITARNSLDPGVLGAARQPLFDALKNINPAHADKIAGIIQDQFPAWKSQAGSPADKLRLLMFPAAKSMAGSDYQKIYNALNTELETAGAKNNPNYADAIRGVNKALSNAMEASIGQQNPSDVGAFPAARQALENSDVIQEARKYSGAQLDPNEIERAGYNRLGTKGWQSGESSLQPLTGAVKEAMPPLPQDKWKLGSGLLATAGALGGGLTGWNIAGPELGIFGEMMGAAAGAGAGAVPGYAASTVANWPFIQSYLKNQVLPALPEQAGQRQASNFARALLSTTRNGTEARQGGQGN